VTLTATLSSTGCDNSLTIDYAGQTFTNDSVDIVWTNVITPNGDGLNDCFKPGFIGEFSDCYELKVYNRWGALLFESVGTGNCWDGRTKAGNLVPDGTYYYIAKVLEEERAGWVQVLLD
jgi:gliding motility-associated-like protein